MFDEIERTIQNTKHTHIQTNQPTKQPTNQQRTALEFIIFFVPVFFFRTFLGLRGFISILLFFFFLISIFEQF